MIPVPMTTQFCFNDDVFQVGTPVSWRDKVNSHDFHGLVSEIAMDHIQVNNGFMKTGISIAEVIEGQINIYPISDPGAKTEYQTSVFDVDRIPITSILYNENTGAAHLIIEVETYYLVIEDASGNRGNLLSYEIDPHHRIILPPLEADHNG